MIKKQGLALVLVLVLLITNMTTLTAFAAGESYNMTISGPATATATAGTVTYTINPSAVTAGDGLAAYGGILDFNSRYLQFVSAQLTTANGNWTGTGNVIGAGQLKFMVSDDQNYSSPQSSGISLTVKFLVIGSPAASTELDFSFSSLEVLDKDLDDIPTLSSETFKTTITSSGASQTNRTVTINKNITAGSSSVTGAGATYKAGDWVSITATPDSNHTFTGWTVVSGGVLVGNNASTGFLMPDNDVELTANFQGKTRYQVTVNGGAGGSGSGSGLYLPGETVTVTATPASGSYQFSGWTVNNGGASLSGNTATATFTMPANAVEVTANFTATLTAPVLSAGTVNRTSNTAATIGFTTDKAGTAYYLVKDSGEAAPNAATVVSTGNSLSSVNGTVTGKQITLSAGAKVVYVVVVNGAGNSNVLTINVAAYTPGSTTYALTVTSDGNGSASGGGSNSTGIFSITASPNSNYKFNNWTVTSGSGTFANASSTSTTFTFSSGTTATVRANFTYTGSTGGSTSGGGGGGGGGTTSTTGNVTITASSNGSVTTSPSNPSKGDKVTVTVKPNSGHELNTLTIKDSNGNTLSYTDNGNGTYSYTQPDGKVTITATFKATTTPQPTPGDVLSAYTDVSGHWAADYIRVVVERGLFSGTSANTFSPNTSMTRAMFATVLSRLEDVSVSNNGASRFADVPSGQWYTGAVEWAAENGIVSGVGNSNFDPNASITREQMAVMLYRYLQFKGYDLPMLSASSSFGDDGQISSWAKEAVDYMQRAGIINGKPGNLFDPKGIATRAEVATVFAKFIEALEG